MSAAAAMSATVTCSGGCNANKPIVVVKITDKKFKYATQVMAQ